MAMATPDVVTPRVRWPWLWTPKTDLLWNLLPFWIGFALALALYVTRSSGPSAEDPSWHVSIAGRDVQVMNVLLFFYAPLIDAPHIWATIARTYTDRAEWEARRRLFLVSLLALTVGPIVILLPYIARLFVALPASVNEMGWSLWTTFFGFYVLFHINKQHWGFVSLYNRKNGDHANPLETRVDAVCFQVAIWLPYFAMRTAPWYVTRGRSYELMQTALGPTTVGVVLHTACHVLFLGVCAGYALFQVSQWRKGLPRNGAKLLYIATVLSLYYVTFAIHPRIAAFWVIITGTGHCAQYHAVVWAYGRKKYSPKGGEKPTLPMRIFGNVWLYAGLGILFGLVTLQGPVGGVVKQIVGGGLHTSLFSRVFKFLDAPSSIDLGGQVVAAFISGVRLHHFYVDSKIWKVSKSAALAKNLSV